MRPSWIVICVGVALAVCVLGCRSAAQRVEDSAPPVLSSSPPEIEQVAFESADAEDANDAETSELLPLPPFEQQIVSPEELSTGGPSVLSLDEVVASVRNHFPLIQQAAASRRIASGQALSAWGAFDHKLEGFSVSQPLDFYENYRHGLGVKRETMWGGQVFAGYRIGRGFFEPWYLERETNKGGEFKAGFTAPIIRDRWIDSNRAELWQAQLERRRVEPEILAQIILYVRDGGVAYWNWVAAGANHQIAEGLLKLAQERNAGLELQVEAQEKAPIDLVDNRRIIVSREAKLIEARRKLEQAAVKLSLFYRSEEGAPVLVEASQLPESFAQHELEETESTEPELVTDDTQRALAQRPELAELQLVRQQLGVALRQAQNETWPDVDAGVLVAQDVGEPTSSLRDKSELKLEGLLTVSVPLERRKAMGKVRSLRGKLAQVTAKNRFTADKIVADVRIARAALIAAHQRVAWASESFALAVRMQEAEQELFDLGQSTLFNLNIREQQAAEAAAGRVQALLEYFVAQVDYGAAMGLDGPAR